MKKFFFKELVPRLAGIISVFIVHQIPALEGAEEAITSAILAVWGLFEIANAKSTAERDALIEKDQRVLKAVGVYDGKIDGRYGPKTSKAVNTKSVRPNR